MIRHSLALFFMSMGLAATFNVQAADFDLSVFKSIPLQSGGRVKPLDTFARESVLFLTGSRSYKNEVFKGDATEMMLSLISNPEAWNETPFIQIQNLELKRQLLLDEKEGRFTPKSLFSNPALLQYAQKSGTPNDLAKKPIEAASKPNAREQEFKRLLDKLAFFRSIASGEAWLMIPKPAPETWQSVAAEASAQNPVTGAFESVVKSYQTKDTTNFFNASQALRAGVESQMKGLNDEVRRSLNIELLYNELRPFLKAWVLYLIAALLWAATLAVKHNVSLEKKFALMAHITGTLAFLFHTGGILMRCLIAGRPPVTNMYESIVWVAYGVSIFGGVLYLRSKQGLVLAVSSTLSMLALVASDAAPTLIDPNLHPLVPVLRSNYWLTIHVLTITLGYAAFALALGISDVTLFHYIRRTATPSKVDVLNQLTYRATQFGVVLLAAGTILGGIWADYSWGRFWGWDPKETWALIALLCYVAILHGRFAGWVQSFGFAAWSVIAFLSVLMAWYGVNFVLGVGLHSYGFSSGGAVPVAIFTLAHAAWVMIAWLQRRRV